MITTFSELSRIRKDHAGAGIVFTGGVFDIIHQGHVEGIEYRKSLGDILVVGIVSVMNG